MTHQKNSLNDLLQSFSKVCSNLESQAESNLKKIEEECTADFNSSGQILKAFNQLVSGISETYSELLNTNDILKSATNRAIEENVFPMPYEIQLSTVNCIKNLYKMEPVSREFGRKKIIDETKSKLIDELALTSEKNFKEVINVETAIQDVTNDPPGC